MFIEYWDSISLAKRLYERALEPILKKYKLTRMELDILLFLANNQPYDTATDIIQRRGLTKSHVSSSVKDLVERKYLEKSYTEGNSKLAHLKIMPLAETIIAEGQRAQRQFFNTVLNGLTKDEIAAMKQVTAKAADNCRNALDRRA